MSGVGRLLDTGLVLLLPRDKGMESVDFMASRLSARLRLGRRPGKFSDANDMVEEIGETAALQCPGERAISEGDE